MLELRRYTPAFHVKLHGLSRLRNVLREYTLYSEATKASKSHHSRLEIRVRISEHGLVSCTAQWEESGGVHDASTVNKLALTRYQNLRVRAL